MSSAPLSSVGVCPPGLPGPAPQGKMDFPVPPLDNNIIANLADAFRENQEFYREVMTLARQKNLDWIFTRKAPMNDSYGPAAKRPKYEPGGGMMGGGGGGGYQSHYGHMNQPPMAGPKRPYQSGGNHMMSHMQGGGGGGGYSTYPPPPPPPVNNGPPMFNDLNDVARCRLSEDDRRRDQAFNSYQTGEPSKRLYVKNISRLTTENDLRSLYRLFCEDGATRYTLKYFTSGKMRYQCFVEYETMEAALSALVHTNGVMIHDKPICVSFGKSR